MTCTEFGVCTHTSSRCLPLASVPAASAPPSISAASYSWSVKSAQSNNAVAVDRSLTSKQLMCHHPLVSICSSTEHTSFSISCRRLFFHSNCSSLGAKCSMCCVATDSVADTVVSTPVAARFCSIALTTNSVAASSTHQTPSRFAKPTISCCFFVFSNLYIGQSGSVTNRLSMYVAGATERPRNQS